MSLKTVLYYKELTVQKYSSYYILETVSTVHVFQWAFKYFFSQSVDKPRELWLW